MVLLHLDALRSEEPDELVDDRLSLSCGEIKSTKPAVHRKKEPIRKCAAMANSHRQR